MAGMGEEWNKAHPGSVELRLILVGTIDCGKTLTADTLLGQCSPLVSTLSSRSCQLRRGLSHSRRLTLVEAPRWYWSGGHLESSVQEETRQALSLAAPGPHAFLLLIPVSQFTEIERRIPQQIEEVFGRGALQHTLVVLTCGDYLLGRPAEQYLAKEDQGLREVIKLCEGRYHVINNRQPENREQVIQLLKKVERMVQQNGGCYIKGVLLSGTQRPSLMDEVEKMHCVNIEYPWSTRGDGAKHKGLMEKAEMDEAEAEREGLEKGREEREIMDKERLEKERDKRLKKMQVEEERQEKERAERERIIKEREERERKEKERLEREMREKEQLEKERTEKERLQRERAERDKIMKEREDSEEKEKEKLEMERRERERSERERIKKILQREIAEKDEHERAEQEKTDGLRKEKERAERERLEKEKEEEMKRRNKQRIEKEQERKEMERQEKERAERERIIKERDEMLETERRERERLERIEKERAQWEKAEAWRREKERAERERQEQEMEEEMREKERVEKEKLDQEREKEKERTAKEKLKRELDKERLEKERVERARAEKERRERETARLEKARAEIERRVKKGAEQEKQQKEERATSTTTSGLHSHMLPQKQELIEQQSVSHKTTGSSQSAADGAILSQFPKTIDDKTLKSIYYRIMTGEDSFLTPELRLVLLGCTRSGKSAAGNAILGRQEFESRAKRVVTQQCEKGWAILGNRCVAVVDTPDWFCSECSPEEMRSQLSSCMALSSPGPHAFLLCVPVHQPPSPFLSPLSPTPLQALRALEAVFGPRMVSGHTLVLFTYSDCLEEGRGGGGRTSEVEKYITSKRPDLLKLVERCGDHYHILERAGHEDGGGDKEEEREKKSVEELLEKVTQMVKENGGDHYSCPLYQEVESLVKHRQEEILQARRERRMKRRRREEGGGEGKYAPPQCHLVSLKEDAEVEEEEGEGEGEEEEAMEVEKSREEAEKSVRLDFVPVLSLPSAQSTSLLCFIREKVGAGVKRVPKLLAGGALLGGSLGAFFGGLLGGAMGASGGAALAEVARRKLSKHTDISGQSEEEKKDMMS